MIEIIVRGPAMSGKSRLASYLAVKLKQMLAGDIQVQNGHGHNLAANESWHEALKPVNKKSINIRTETARARNSCRVLAVHNAVDLPKLLNGVVAFVTENSDVLVVFPSHDVAWAVAKLLPGALYRTNDLLLSIRGRVVSFTWSSNPDDFRGINPDLLIMVQPGLREDIVAACVALSE